MNYINRISDLGACREAMNWLRTERHPDIASAWAKCPRGDWMLWLAGRMAGPPGDPSRIPLVLAACECAEPALKYVPEGEDRPRIAIETARRWARGEATMGEVRAAADAADDADAAAAVYAAAYAAYAASSAAHAAAYAADAVYAAYRAAKDHADDAERAVLATCADIVRRHYPAPPEGL